MKWPMVKLGSVCRVIPGFAFKSADFTNEGIPVVKIASIRDDYTVDLSDAQCWPNNLFTERLRKFILKDKDILVAMTGATAGKVGRLRTAENALLNQRVAKIESDKIDSDFIWFVLSSPRYRERFYSIAGGAAQPNMSGGQIEAVEVPEPPRQIQNRIASILSAYDDLIENNTRRIKLLEDAARLLYEEWFVRLRFPGHEHVKVKDGVPEGWEQKTVGEVSPLLYGKALKADMRIEGSVPVYGSSGIVGTHEAALVKGPGIIVGRKGNVGSIHLSMQDFWPIDTVYYVEPSRFSYYLLHNLQYQNFISSDVAVPGLNRSFAESLPVLTPTAIVAEQFEEQSRTLYQQVATLTQLNAKVTAARDLLLPRLMSGEVAV